ncbi:nucleoside hydrolase [Plantactinospora soyae]|uniref:Purine nucleosidase n=1 Tax=Plantactinospora soyae TaxID=1544732 RepID=A0A927M8B0_9ACTN|nr:nucleoside hydrolase [Plantactinospora soyae]MBE1488436.1 purine nucleosidase [Plantactinospora soyae]
MNVPPRRTATALLAVALVVAGQWFGPVPAAGQRAGENERHPAGTPVPVIYDSDMDFDDASTLALLCEEHKLGRIDLRAVTVANNGFGEPRRALTHARSVLDQCGLPQVPTADGATGAGVHPAPPELVSTIETVLTAALADADHPTPPSPITAAQLIALTARTAPRQVVVLATGPLTNLADALASDRVRGRIARIHVMGGALAVPGNLYGSALPGFDNSQEFNIWLDPGSAQRMLTRARPGVVRLVPLDATRFVPITPAFVSRLGADQHAPGARIAYRIASQPDLAALIDLGIMYWWDALAAVSVVHDGVVTLSRTVPVSIVQDGVQSGRTVTTRHGTPVRAAIEADRAAFEEIFLDSLNGRR